MAEALGGAVAAWGGARPTLVQAAIDGGWENPILVSGTSEADAWLVGSRDVAVEIFFGPDLFLGARLTGLDRLDRVEFVRQLVGAAEDPATTFCDAPRFWRLPDGRPLPLHGPPSFLEVGVVNAWQSVGSVVLWRHGDDHVRTADLSPALRRAQPTPVALEAAHRGTVHSWTGRNVSTAMGDGSYLLDEVLLEHVAAVFLDRP